MIPLRDNIPSRTTPYVNYVLIALNAAIFLYQTTLSPLAELQLFYHFGIVPKEYFDPDQVLRVATDTRLHPVFYQITLDAGFHQFVTSMFLHGGFFHLLGNMWVLWIFGDNVEDAFGHFRYALLYLLAGLAAGVTHLLTQATSSVPTIGASGAIAGVMGAYLVLYPHARVLTLIPIFFLIQFVELPAVIFLGLWFLLQLFQGTVASAGGVAWWAHIGGFVAGVLLIRVLPMARPPARVRARRPGGSWNRWGGPHDPHDRFW